MEIHKSHFVRHYRSSTGKKLPIFILDPRFVRGNQSK
jgi:hypothetical protein